MAPKRQADTESEELTSREKKKQKVAFARTIAVQSAKSVTYTENAVAGPSNQSGINSLEGLPSTIDVEKFAEARAFEIDAMENAMKSASTSSTQRAWQSLPRHLRRRAASHDVRRVPLRLREKARAEMDPVRKKAPGRSLSKLGKSKRLTRTESFLKRQKDKTWLETHIWHAKRMKMENMWGYRLAVHPSEKAFRPSHRASLHGSILHDASYYSLIELKGPQTILKSILEACCDPQGPGPGSKRYIAGSRCLDTHIYRLKMYPFDLIGPATVIWRPFVTLTPSLDEHSDEEGLIPPKGSETQQATPRRKRKKKAKNKSNDDGSSDTQACRTVWLRVHPSIFNDIFSCLQNVAASTLDVARKTSGNNEIEIELADLRNQINVFEIMGPKSSQILKGALTPVPQDQRREFTEFWNSLTHLQTAASVPRNMIIGFKVIDPRLKFPPKNAKVIPPGSDHVSATITSFPSSFLAQTEIWDHSVRDSLQKPRYKKKDIDERKAKNLIPGTPLKAHRQDDRIPVMLIQRSLENSGSSTQGIHGWTLIIPASWSMAFFSSLTFTGTRVGGQRERQTQAFEAGIAYFPRDYPSSSGYDIYAAERYGTEKARWTRKPPAKRPNFEKLGTSSPWKGDWEVILGLKERPPLEYGLEDEDTDFGSSQLVTTQREAEADVEMGVDENPQDESDEGKIKPWLLRGCEVPGIISNISKLFNHAAGLLEEMNKLRLKRGQEATEISFKADELLKAALVSVRVILGKRGVPEDLALIYSVSDDEAREWEKVLQKHQGSLAAHEDGETPEEIHLSELKPSESSIIGSVTTGHFSMSQGEGFAIGAIPVVRYLELQEQGRRLHPTTTSKFSAPLVKVRNTNGQRCRVARLELLDA